MREPSEARRRRILAAVQSRGSVRVTDLATELDVSVVTVRRDVEELAKAGTLRRGHGTARSLRAPEPTPAPPLAEGGAVALVVPERHAYLHETMHGARTALEEAGMRVVLHIAPQVAGAERPIVERVLAEDVRGLLIAPRWRTTAAELADDWLAQVRVPLVLMERRPWPGSALHGLDSVCTDHWYGMHLAVAHLVALGHRRIVLAARDDSPTARTLRAAFAEIASYRAEIEDWAVVLSAADAGAEPEVRVAGTGEWGPLTAERSATGSASGLTRGAADWAVGSDRGAADWAVGSDRGAAEPELASGRRAPESRLGSGGLAAGSEVGSARRAAESEMGLGRRGLAPEVTAGQFEPGMVAASGGIAAGADPGFGLPGVGVGALRIAAVAGSPRRTGEQSALAAVLREHRATAAILHGDVDALMLVQQLAEAGIRVPDDCSIVAYDDVVAALGSPPLTAVAPPKAQVGRAAAELLLHRLASSGEWRSRRVELIPDLKVRGSTRPV
ncbi:substrate-binding domain-containing protein [Crossiella cryophila]|uniref:DNA-binding LacI/PurR family transcriptional regulator n=1 Tax=Crossiella cryophila TaxID=43355 RepID=A0A7W7CFM9_9PSEU|nr:substrate-binding domain-containing protein [Crossiella cryophila]MBB4680352.1 DNA-binding LacI/PurR family transcriptional regulator [Crossiella cryophila]